MRLVRYLSKDTWNLKDTEYMTKGCKWFDFKLYHL